MSKALLVFLLGLCSFVARAQTTPDAPAAPTPPTTRFELTQGRRDTLGAIANLFHRRRRGALVWGIIGGAGTLSVARGIASGNGSNTEGALVGLAVFGGIPAALSISKLVRFSDKREEEVDRAYRSGQPLPRAIARRLKYKDFFH